MNTEDLVLRPTKLGYDDICKITGYSRSGIDKLRRNGKFPEPIKYGKNCSWTIDDINKFFIDRLLDREIRQEKRNQALMSLPR